MIQIVEVVREIVADAQVLYGKPIYFYADDYVMINNELTIKGRTTEGMKQKYPAIMLFCDNIPVKHVSNGAYGIEATLRLLIAANAPNKGEDGDYHREHVFYPVLYPINNCFIEAIMNNTIIYSNEDSLDHKTYDRYRLGKANNKAMFPDYLDGVEIEDLKLKVKKECY